MAEDIHWQHFAARYKVYDKLVQGSPLTDPDMIICIPSYAEPELLNTLESIFSCDHPGNRIEVLVLFNQDDRMSNEEKELHALSYTQCLEWVKHHQASNLIFHPIWLEKMNISKWGVGWARKLLMDEAARRLNQDGVIVNLDADCVVSKNYLVAIKDHFDGNDQNAISIYVEHDYENTSEERRNAIIDYELHLRYLVHAKRWAGHPFAFQTFGSAMAVRRSAYLKQGGMNTRQAGEDFYFLQKFIETGDLLELNSTTVFPSERNSLRVPFGTGKAMHDLQMNKTKWKTTPFETFELIKPLFTQVQQLFEYLNAEQSTFTYPELASCLRLEEKLISYLTSIHFIDSCREILEHTSTSINFEKRFFRKFNAFAVIRYMHDMHLYGYEEVEVIPAARKLTQVLGMKNADQASNEDCLLFFRKLDKGRKIA